MKKIILVTFGLALMIISCKKNKSSEIDYNPNVLSSKDYIRGEDAMYEVVNAFLKGVYDSLVNESGYNYIDNCDVTFRPQENALSFNYGSVDRYCQDNKFRRGHFTATFTGPIFNPGVKAHIVTDSLFVDDFLQQMVMDMENTGLNGNNQTVFTLKMDTSNIMLPDTTKLNGVHIKTDFTLVWAQGESTPPIHEDDMFLVSGSATGISTDGYNFSVSIIEPLENWLDCYWISQGLCEITVLSAEFPTGDIDYIQDDGCSNKFNFYFNDNFFYDAIK